MRIAALVAGATVLTVWTLRGGIVGLYSRDAAVVATALTLIPYLAAFHFFDALQTVASFVLRAYKLAIAPTVIHAVALWGLGVAGGYLVAFGGLWGPPWGIAGMWLMQSVAPRAGRATAGRLLPRCRVRSARAPTIVGHGLLEVLVLLALGSDRCAAGRPGAASALATSLTSR